METSRQFEIVVDPDFIHDPEHIRRLISEKASARVDGFEITRRSVDARSKRPRFVLKIDWVPQKKRLQETAHRPWKPVRSDHSVLIVGAGPAGLFAALELARLGIKPVILERGESVRSRNKTIANLLRHGVVDRESNYCFGEGGAGTYSDGKLYTRSKKRGDVRAVLDILVAHGAHPDILIDAHPHIGSNKLPTIVGNIRHTLLGCGGEIHFESKVSDFAVKSGRLDGVITEGGQTFQGDAVILAMGHSAQEIFECFRRKDLLIEPKPFAVGIRLEHPQTVIDQMQYHHTPRHPNLPPAAYGFVSQMEGRGVYSFCMCPGGRIVPSSTTPDALVVNGMSNAKRNSKFANSGIVVEIRMEDIGEFSNKGPFAFLDFQKALEQQAFLLGGASGQQAPGQRVTDFIAGKMSSSLPAGSYLPGIRSAPVHELFQPELHNRLKNGIIAYGKTRKGFLTREALVLAVESRTSSPVRIPRDGTRLTHPDLRNCYPCGEGAGYAGGIVSSAIDGRRVARKIAENLGCL